MAPRPPLAYPQQAVAMSNARTTRAPRKPRTPAADAAATTPAKPAGPAVEFMGQKYRVAEKLGIWPQMQLARAAQDGINLGEPRGLAAVYSTLENVIHPDDWGRFEKDMITNKTDDLLQLLKVMQDAVQIIARRDGLAVAAPEQNAANGKADAAVPGSLAVNT